MPYTWTFILPPDQTSLRFPTLPAQFTASAPQPMIDNIGMRVRLIEVPTVDGYDALRAIPERNTTCPDCAVRTGEIPRAIRIASALVEQVAVHSGFIWISGRWDWQRTQWRWINGHEVGQDPELLTRPDGTNIVNGCGPEFTRWFDEFGDGTRFEDEHTYLGGEGRWSAGSPAYVVNFCDACNLHDAGYEGCGPSNPGDCKNVVHDKINNRNIDYSTKSRKWIDDNFRRDMWLLCEHMVATRNGVIIPESHKNAAFAAFALASCRQRGQGFVVGPWGAETLYRLVRDHGESSFKNPQNPKAPRLSE